MRQQQLEGVAILVSFVLGSPVLQGAMKHYHASDAIVYGVIPAAAPLIIVGTTVLGIAASTADWPQFGAALAVVIGGVVAALWERAPPGSQPASPSAFRSSGTPPRRASSRGAPKEMH